MAVTRPAHPLVRRLPALARSRHLPRLALLAAFALSAAWLAWQARHVTSFIWLIDEALYVKEAQAYGDLQGLLPHVHGNRHGVPNILYPVLLAPLYALFSAPAAFELGHILNGVAWASTIFPVYLLARRLGASWPFALAGGLIAVWLPWAVAVDVAMTEAVTYPAFAWAMLAMTVAVADPRPRNDALALLAIVVTILGRTQFVFLLAALLLAIVAYSLSLREPGRPWWRRLRGHWALGALLLAGALAVFGISLADAEFLGGYSITTGLPPFPNGLWLAAGQHLAHLVVGVGVLPAILYVAWLLAQASGPPRPSAERAFAVVGTVCFALLIYQAAFFMQNIGAVMQERYISYGAPILVVGMVAFLASPASAGARLSVLAGAAVTSAAVVGAPFVAAEAATPFDTVANGNAAYSGRLIPFLEDLTEFVPGRSLRTVESLVLVTVVLGVVAALVLAARPRWRSWLALGLCSAVLVFTVDETRYVVPLAITGINSAFPYTLVGARDIQPDWVDDAVPGDTLVGMQVGRLRVPDEMNQWLWTTFWNKSIQRTYSFDGRMGYSGWPGESWQLDPATGRLTTPEEPDRLVASQVDPLLRVDGRIVATSPYNAVVIEPVRPLRARWALRGADSGGAPVRPGQSMRLLFYPRPAPRVRLTLSVDALSPEAIAAGETASVPYVVEDGRRRIRGKLAAGTSRDVVVEPRAGGGGPAAVTIRQRRTRLPQGEVTLRLIGVQELG